MQGFEIECFLAADANQFFVTTESLGPDRACCYRIERAYALAVMRDPDGQMCTHVAPVGDSGMAVTEDMYIDVRLVHGRDMASCGKTWQAIFDSISPTVYGVREIPSQLIDEDASTVLA